MTLIWHDLLLLMSVETSHINLTKLKLLSIMARTLSNTHSGRGHRQ